MHPRKSTPERSLNLMPQNRKRAPKLDGHYEAEDLGSVWIGTFPDEQTFNDSLEEDYSSTNDHEFPRCRFWDALGIQWHDHDFQEATFSSAAIPIEKLIAGISWVESYKADLLKRCTELGISRANTVIVMYEYDYPPEAGFNSPNLTFVGSFRYTTGSHPFRRNAK
jgi:hypothetical protein